MQPSNHALGGFWTDRSDARAAVEERLATRTILPEDAERLRHWITHGWVVIESAVDPAVVDAYGAEFRELIAKPSSEVMLFNNQLGAPEPLRPELFAPAASPKVLDHYVHSENARRVLFADGVMRFLELLFGEPALLFQGLGFEYGSRQGIHQDTAYVVVHPPLSFVGVWIALEDIAEGSGELEYYDQSHLIPHHFFGPSRKHWIPSEDGSEGHSRWLEHLHGQAQQMGLAQLKFRPRSGSALFWHADLAHGGSPVSDDSATRRSVVGHYCPESAVPHYCRLVSERSARIPYGKHFYSSYYYSLGG